MPVLVEVPVNHDTFRPISDRLRERVDREKRPAEEVAEVSAEKSARSARLRDQHLESVKERAQRDLQRAEEAAARKRRVAADETRKLIAKMEAASQKHDERKQEQKTKLEKEKEKRQALAEAALAARVAAQHDVAKKGVQMAMRTSRASEVRTEKLSATVKRNQRHLEHALEVIEKKRAGATEGGDDGGDDSIPEEQTASLSPHPQKDVMAPAGLEKSTAKALGLDLSLGSAKDISGNDTPRAGSDDGRGKVLTPRASPRRVPELPTIREEDVVCMVPGDIVEVPNAPKGIRSVQRESGSKRHTSPHSLTTRLTHHSTLTSHCSVRPSTVLHHLASARRYRPSRMRSRLRAAAAWNRAR